MWFDIERLRYDAQHWDECGAPYDAEYVAIVPDGTLVFYRQDSVGTWQIWGVHHKQWLFDGFSHDAGSPPYDIIPRPEENNDSKPMDDNCLAAKIGEIGNMLHNMACAYQGYECLPDELGNLACALWDLSKHAPKTEWVDGLPPVGATNKEFKLLAHISVACNESPETEYEVVAHYDGRAVVAGKSFGREFAHLVSAKMCRPIQTEAEKQRDELAQLLANQTCMKYEDLAEVILHWMKEKDRV